MVLLLITLAIVFEAISDSYRYKFEEKLYRYSGELYHLFKALQTLVFLILGWVLNTSSLEISIIILVLGYALLRFGIFDFVYNVLIGVHYLYIGTTSFFDKIMGRIFKSATAKMFYLLLKGISIMAGMYLIQHRLFVS